MPITTPAVFFRSLLISILICYSSFSSAQITPKIIGGKPSNLIQWPWMAGIVLKGRSSFDGIFCGASLIAKDWVLTAAHCVFDEKRSTIEIIINQADLDNNEGERLSVDRILVHPLFDTESLLNDIALVKLRTPSTSTPITVLPTYSIEDSAGQDAIALGWGTTSAVEPKYPKRLHQADLSIISNPKCLTALVDGITENMLCAGVPSAKQDTCQGDSGGPLIVFDSQTQSWRQVGITSWGDGCARKGFYGVYTRVKKYASFISDNICSANEKLTPPSLSLSLNKELFDVTAHWSTSNKASGYRLHYAPFPQAQPIYTLDVSEITLLSANSRGAFYVAMSSYKNNCISGFSNIEHFDFRQ
ncbi:MAG: serine protease [Methylococcales bacterium]|nr:serine protease [Methylococcales bacterium]